MPLTATLSKDVAFLHLIAAPYTLPFRQELQRLEHSLRSDGFPEAEIAQAINLMRLKIEYPRTGKGWDEYFAARQKAQGQKWDRGASGPETKHSEDWQWMKMNFFYNPLPELEKITIPVLSLHAGKDTYVLPDVNVSILEMALEKAGNKDYTIKTIPNANHQFMDTTRASDGKSTVRKYAPGFYETLIEWTKRRMNVVP